MSCSVEIRTEPAGHVLGHVEQLIPGARWLVTYVGPQGGGALPLVPLLGYVLPRGCAVGVDDAEHALVFMTCPQFRVVDTRPVPMERATLDETARRGLAACARRRAA